MLNLISIMKLKETIPYSISWFEKNKCVLFEIFQFKKFLLKNINLLVFYKTLSS